MATPQLRECSNDILDAIANPYVPQHGRLPSSVQPPPRALPQPVIIQTNKQTKQSSCHPARRPKGIIRVRKRLPQVNKRGRGEEIGVRPRALAKNRVCHDGWPPALCRRGIAAVRAWIPSVAARAPGGKRGFGREAREGGRRWAVRFASTLR